VGAWADLVVFDPERIIDVATYDDPHRYPAGIDHVMVNGAVVTHGDETLSQRPGRFLRLGRDAGLLSHRRRDPR
jgi:N-acyl-D-aspartate/D-glutamate deacylase